MFRQCSLPPTTTAGTWGLLKNLTVHIENADNEMENSGPEVMASIAALLVRLVKRAPEGPEFPTLQTCVVAAVASIDLQVWRRAVILHTTLASTICTLFVV